MLVIPAIDLKDGEAVRLYKGDYNKKVVYSSHPEELAAGFEKMGAVSSCSRSRWCKRCPCNQ